MTTKIVAQDPPTLFSQGYRMKAATDRTFGTFLVTNPRGRVYTVTPLENYCTCPDCRLNGHYCKHLRNLYALMLDCWYEVNDDPAHEVTMYAMREEMDFVLEQRRAMRRAA